MVAKLGLLITLLSVGIFAETSETQNEEPFSIEKVWRKTACPGRCPPDWVKPVQRYYDTVTDAFNTFPDQVAGAGDSVISTFQALLTKVIEFSNSPSKILSSGANGILDSFASVRVDNISAQGIIDEFTRVLPILMSAYRKVVSDLTCVIGPELVCAVNTAISDLECEFKKYVKEFEANEGKKEVDYEPVQKRVQKLTDTIALKGDVQLTECQLEDPDVQDALVVLSLVLDYVLILVHGLSSSSEAVIIENQCEPVIIHVVVVAVGTFVSEITESLVVNTAPNAFNVPKHLENISKGSNKLNQTLTALFKAVGKITQQLTKTVQGLAGGLLKPLRLIG